MNKSMIATLLALLSTQAWAYGEAGQWSSGWGQGTTEYTAVVDEKNSLYIACNDTAKVSMTATVNGKEYGSYSDKSFNIDVDGSHYDTPYETESRVGENNFFDMWDKMRQAKTITITTADGQKLSLPVKGAATILPATRSKGFNCVMWNE